MDETTNEYTSEQGITELLEDVDSAEELTSNAKDAKLATPVDEDVEPAHSIPDFIGTDLDEPDFSGPSSATVIDEAVPTLDDVDEPAERGESVVAKTLEAAKSTSMAAGTSVLEGFSAMKEVRQASRDHTNAKAQLEEIQKEIENAQAELDHRVAIENSFEEIVGEQNAALADAQTAHAGAQELLDKLNAERDDLAAQLEEMKKTHETELKPYKDIMESSKGRSDDASKALNEAKRALKLAEGQVNEATSSRDSRMSSANKAVDNAKARLNELRDNLAALQADPASDPATIEEVNQTILAESNHLVTAEEEAESLSQEMQRSMDNAQAHLWTQKQSLETAERAFESAKAEAASRKEEYDKLVQDAATAEATLDNAVVERELAIRDANKDLEDAATRIETAQALLDEAREIHANPQLTEELRDLIYDNKNALSVQEGRVEDLANAEKSIRERTRTQRISFAVAVALAVVLFIFVMWLIFGQH